MRKLKTEKSYFVPIPHLNYKVMYGVSPKEFTGRQSNSLMFTEDTNKNMVSIIFKEQPKSIDISTISHEVVHALQYVCQRRNIKMEISSI